MHALKVFRSPVWPHYRYIRKMRRGDRLPLTQKGDGFYLINNVVFRCNLSITLPVFCFLVNTIPGILNS